MSRGRVHHESSKSRKGTELKRRSKGTELKRRSNMDMFALSSCLVAFFFLVLYFQKTTAEPNSSFSFKDFGKNSNFKSQLALYGDAKVLNDGSSMEITGSFVMSKKSIKLVEGNPRKMVSFSTSFSFSMSPENGDGVAFVMVPLGFPLNVLNGGSFGLLSEMKMKPLAVEFDSSTNEKYRDVNDNHVGVDIDSLVSVKVRNASSINLVLNSGEKLHAWIDYEASSKRLEVRLSKLRDVKPIDPLLSCPIDLSQMWKEEDVVLGLGSSSGNSSQKCYVYSWSFNPRRVPQWMHSQPLDPGAFEEKTKALDTHKKDSCALRIVAALIFGTACGAFGALLVSFIWNIFGNSHPVLPEGYPVHPEEFECRKFKVVVDKAIEGSKMNV